MTERRHPHVSNLDETEEDSLSQGTRFGARIRSLGRATGSRELGCNWFEVAPGKTAFPFHYHCNIEEALFVLEGTATLRLGDDRVALRSGDWVTFLAGPEHPHQVINTGDEPLRYLCVSNRARADICCYPDSDKLLAFASPHTDSLAEPWVRAVHRRDQTVGYYDGEDTGASSATNGASSGE